MSHRFSKDARVYSHVYGYGTVLDNVGGSTCIVQLDPLTEGVKGLTIEIHETLLGHADDFVPCMFCAKVTQSTGTKQCGNCYEVVTRIKGMPDDVLQKIMNSLGRKIAFVKPMASCARTRRMLREGRSSG